MDKNETLERRFSLNMTHLPNPIAESTCVNLNGSATRNAVGAMRSAAGEFRWGGSPISPKNRSNSSICLNNTNAVHKSTRTAISPQRARMNLSKIDPRIYADVQSRGLVSRIVQYHENGSRLNRSMSTSNLYGKSGHSSIAQLQKNELPYRATQQNVAMTRIEPPKKSVFYGNTLSSLLRSNSVISVQKSDEELSCENRPIMHPPPTENELAPTRSVLDVLKEISRKRINSDDSDGIHDANKKYCSRDYKDAPSEPAASFAADPRNIGMLGPVAGTMSTPGQTYKRQREQMVAPHQQQPLRYKRHLNGITNGPSTRSPLHTHHSPEQIAKKRICSYNNDITSSLSSSLIHVNKRKFYEQQRSKANQHSPPSLIEEFEAQKSKIQCQQDDLRFQQLTKGLNSNTPITPLPTTPLNATGSMPTIGGNIENITDIPRETSATVKQTISEPIRLNDKFSSKPQKPKLTLFNRNYNEPQSLNTINGNDDELAENYTDVDDGECADIQFVKPKKSSDIVNKKNPLIERTQKSKLAMMLSGLRGEIYQGEESNDEVDKNTPNKAHVNTTNQSKLLATNGTSTIDKIASTVSTTTTTNNATNFVMKAPEKSMAVQPTQISSTTTGPATTASASITTSAPNSNTTTTLSAPITTTTSSTVGSFQLTASPPSISSSSPTVTSVIVTKTASPLVGIKLTPQKQVHDSNGGTSSIIAPTLNFGATSTASTAATKSFAGTIATGIGAVPQLQGFSFGLTTKSTTSMTATTTATFTATGGSATVTSASNVGGFKFEATKNKAAIPTTITVTTTTVTTAVAAPTFGSFANAIASTTTTVNTETPKPVFAFGGGGSAPPASSTSTSSTATKPTFNFGGNAVTTATTTATPVFGASGTGAFTFGGTSNPSTTGAASAPSAANQSATTPATQALNLFGGGGGATNNAFALPASALSANTFAFGAAATTTPQSQATNAISGGAILAKTNSTAPTAATTNLFSFGGDKSTAASNAAATTTTTATPFGFGANIQKAATTASTTSTNTNKPVFSFGSAGGSATANPLAGAANTNSSSGNLFSFGGKSTSSESTLFGNNAAAINNSQTTVSQPGGAFTFGAVTAQAPTPAFGGSNATSSAAAFGATKATSTTLFAFGGGGNANKPPTSTSTMGGAANNTGGFSFGSSNTNAVTGSNTGSTNIFGTAASTLSNNPAATAASNTNIVKPSFNFSGGASTKPNTNETANKSIFGGVAANTNSNNVFGAFAGTSFTDKTANSNNNATPNNPFAAAASKPAVGGFSFTTNTANIKATAAPTASTPFAFGGAANNAAAATTATPFSFGGSSNNSGAPPNKAFTFGSSGGNNNSSVPTMNVGSIFGGGVQQGAASTTNIQQAAVTPFSFSAGTSTGAAPAPTAANIFAPPTVPGAGSSGERQIRRATRRLQKT